MPTVTPETWAAQISHPPLITGGGGRSGLIRRWRGADAHISQPPLDHHYVVLHLGGPKRVTRSGDGGQVTFDVEEGTLTVVPAGTRYEWTTEGPIDFAHLYVHPTKLNHAIAMVFDREAAHVTLLERVGVRDPLLGETLRAMLAEVQEPERGRRAYAELLFDCAVAILVRHHSTAGEVEQPARHALAPARLRRVLDYMEASIDQPVALATLAEVAGLSRFHFSRAFSAAMGEPPLAFLARRRLEFAKQLLRSGEEPVQEVARRTGFRSASRFAYAFRAHTGLSPSDYRRRL